MSAPRTLLCFGDSNTHGTRAMRSLEDNRRFGPEVRWPGVMAAALGPGWRVIEEGHPGRTTVHDDPIEGAHKNGARALPMLLESHRPLDHVIIMLGTNDLKARFGVTAFDIALSLGKLVERVAACGCAPGGGAPACTLIAPAPIEEVGFLGDIFAGGATKSRALAPHVDAIARRAGAGFFDAGTAARIDPVDGIHLDRDSHIRLGAALAAVVGSS